MRLFPRLILMLCSGLFPALAIAAACGCSEVSISKLYQDSQVIFLGEALRYIKSNRGPQWTVLRFTPSETWKGAGGSFVDIEVPTKDGSCSIEILIGHSYLVFAKAETDGTLLSTPCLGTKSANLAVSDLKFLRSISSASVASSKTRFSDVPTNHPYHESISALRKAGVVSGYPDRSFRPERPVTRAELAKILDGSVLPYDFIERRIRQFSFTDTGLPFSDIADRAWYNLPVRRAYRAGLIQGFRDGTFRPNQSVTVAEASKMVVTALSLESPDLGAVWYERFIKAVTERKAMPQTVRSIEMPMTRGELSEMIWRLAEHIENRPYTTSEDLLEKKCLTSADSDIAHVDMRKVRETWLDWYNTERKKRNLPAYVFEPYLNRSAALWSNRAAGKLVINHMRDGTIQYYDYSAIKEWFVDLGLEFRNINGITFTENIGRGPYTCSESDCTKQLLDAIHYTFDYFLSEEDKTYRPHFNAMMNPTFRVIGLGIAVKNKEYYLTTHFGTDIISSPPRLCSVDR